VLMLNATMRVRDHEHRSLPRCWRRAWASGRAAWSAYYGEQLVERMRSEARARRSGRELARAARALVRYCRPTIVAHARRKLARLIRGLPPAPLEPGRFATFSGGARDAGS